MVSPWVIFGLLVAGNYISNKKDSLKRKSIMSLLSFPISMLYTLLVAGALSPFMCKKMTNSSFVLISSPSILCYESVWNRFYPLVVSFIILYIVLFPLFVIALFWKNRSNVHSPLFMQNYGHLISSFRESFFFWELVVFVRKGVFAGLAQSIPLYPSGDTEPYFLSVLFLFFFLGIETFFSPFKKHSVFVKSFMWTILAILLLLCDGFVFKSVDVSSFQKTAFGALMIVLIVGTLLVSVGALFLEIWTNKRKGLKTANSASQIDPDGASNITGLVLTPAIHSGKPTTPNHY
jgi:hypothetical protein